MTDVPGISSDWNYYVSPSDGFSFFYPNDWQLEQVSKNAEEIKKADPEESSNQFILKGPRGFSMQLDDAINLREDHKTCLAEACPHIHYLEVERNNVTITGGIYRVNAEVRDAADSRVLSRHVTLIEYDKYDEVPTSGSVARSMLNNYFDDSRPGRAFRRFDISYSGEYNQLTTNEFFKLAEVEIAKKIISSSGYDVQSFARLIK